MMNKPRLRPGVQGFTLVELLVAVAVLGVIMAVAAPSFKSLIEVQRLRSINSQLITDLQFARNEAATRGTPMRVVFDNNASVTCYSLFTSAGTPLIANGQRCDCLRGPGSACGGSVGTSEVRTVSIPRSLGVLVLPLDLDPGVAFDPATGGLLSIPMDRDSLPMPQFRVQAALDAQRRFFNILNQAGRPTVCSPIGTTLGATPCP